MDDVGIHDNFFSLGGDDLLFSGLLQDIQQEYGVDTSIFSKCNFSTLYSQERAIKKCLNMLDHNNIIITLQEGSDEDNLPVLIAVHPIAGTLFSYMKLITEMKIKNTIYGVQDCIFSGDMRMFDSVASQACFYIEELKKIIAPDQHVILMGYSAGGSIANEIAYQMQQQHYCHVQHMVLFDSWVSMPFSLDFRKNLLAIIERNFDKNQPHKFFETESQLDYWLNKVIWNRMSTLFINKTKPVDIDTTVFVADETVADYAVDPKMVNDWVHYGRQVLFHHVLGKHENMLDDFDLDPIITVLKPIIEQCANTVGQYE